MLSYSRQLFMQLLYADGAWYTNREAGKLLEPCVVSYCNVVEGPFPTGLHNWGAADEQCTSKSRGFAYHTRLFICFVCPRSLHRMAMVNTQMGTTTTGPTNRFFRCGTFHRRSAIKEVDTERRTSIKKDTRCKAERKKVR